MPVNHPYRYLLGFSAFNATLKDPENVKRKRKKKKEKQLRRENCLEEYCTLKNIGSRMPSRILQEYL